MDKVYRCNICQAKLPTEERLKKHKRVHDNNKDQKFRDMAYVDPNNAGCASFINPDGALGVIVGGAFAKRRRKKKKGD
ncbi:C2H2-type zinc finger protein [Nitrososphaera viennensis]|uniref:C2H2-type domain-containing protein n=2 Tax=Nitrososphaera viennensis TaxID=1034015 RepID=A0A060HT63_9ARCH|nr:C2H2-type zinc finger protein [Nitrososphaera viennensis]AIC16676.1 hypothetical protein NVIE_024110 [Nitrososphaera viennensis EN76]UVS68596.1 hypothetical protein NWT39_11890 [Nitrososphaera viennensis]